MVVKLALVYARVSAILQKEIQIKFRDFFKVYNGKFIN